MTKEEFNAFVDENDLDHNSALSIFYENGTQEKITLYRRCAYDEVHDKLSYPDGNIVKGHPPQILVKDLSSPLGTKGILFK